MGGIFASILSGLFSPLFNWLTARSNNSAQITVAGDGATVQAGAATLNAIAAADALNAKRGDRSPWTMLAVAFAAPFAWHTWEVVLDSSRWLPMIEWSDWGIPYVWVSMHVVGSWKVAALPGMFETTEHAVINSLFVGASAALAGAGIIRAIKR